MVGRGTVTTVSVESDFTSEISVFSGNCTALVCEKNSDYQDGLGSSLTFLAYDDVTYWILVTGNDEVVYYRSTDAFDRVGELNISVAVSRRSNRFLRVSRTI